MRKSRVRFLRSVFLVAFAALLVLASVFAEKASAHVSYVLDKEEIASAGEHAAGTPFPGDALALVMVGVVLLIAAFQFIGLRIAEGKLARRIQATLLAADEHVPLIIRILVGAFLIFSGLSGTLFAPQLGVELGALASTVSALQIAAGALLLVGFLVKLGAFLLLALVGIAFLIFGAHGLDQLVMLGVAILLFFEGGMRSSLDSITIAKIGRLRRIGEVLMRFKVYSMPVLRLTLGVTLIWLALTEKLLAPELTEAAVLKYNVPVFPTLRLFALFFGFFEAIIGAHYLLGIFNRLISAIYLLLLVSAIFLFGEGVNHLHLFAVAIAFLIRGAGPYRMDISLYTRRGAKLIGE